MNEMLGKLLPIFLLLLIGFLAKKRSLWNASITEGLKLIIVLIALPAVLFDAFANMEFQISYLYVFLLIFLYCCCLYFIGYLLHKYLPRQFSHPYTKGYMSGFEFGMLGVGLFSAIWGSDQLPVIMLIAFGHELFIWFVYVPFISGHSTNAFKPISFGSQILKTPTMVAIIAGIIINLSGLYDAVGATLIGAGIYATLDFLKPLTSPLILIIIGYTLVFDKSHLKENLRYLLTRTFLVLSLGIGILSLFYLGNIKIDTLFMQAFFAFILLPAPYILSVYIKDKKESEYFTQLLLYNTALSFVFYVILLLITTV